MGIGIWNKLKKSMKMIGERIGGFAKKALVALPKVVDVGKKVIGAVSPILTTALPGSGLVLNGINKGLDYAGRFGNTIGKSLIKELD